VADRYSEYGRSRVYARAAKVADSIMDAGYPVVVDATFLHKKHRDQFRKLAAHRDYSFRILDVDATFCTLVNRIRDRTRINQDDSEADVDVLISQMKSLEPLEKFELQDTIKVDTTGNLDPSDISKLAKDLDLTI
jgi:predicted kinase